MFKIFFNLLKILIERKGFIYVGKEDKKRGGFEHYIYPINMGDPEMIYLLIYDCIRAKFIKNECFKKRLEFCYPKDFFNPQD